MAWELFANGVSVGLVSNYRYLEGREERGGFNTFDGGIETATCVKMADEVFFTAPAHGFSIRNSYELRNPATKQAIKIQIDAVAGVSVHAVVQSDS